MTPDEARVAYAACPLCDSKDMSEAQLADCSRHPLYRSEIPPQMRWMRCGACGHVFTDGYFSPGALELLFSNTNARQRPGWDVHGSRATSAKMVEKVRAALGSVRGRWLDVGFGNGSLLGAAMEYGFEAVGLDLRSESVELMRLYGVETHLLDLADYEPSSPLSVISMADVLEHIPYPKTALERARRILADDGVLLLSMPNTDCFAWKCLDHRGENPYWGELEHYHNFGYRRLCALLAEFGFVATSYGISERYYLCMEVIARKSASPEALGAGPR
jgi:SAM-dependent methyltransferase